MEKSITDAFEEFKESANDETVYEARFQKGQRVLTQKENVKKQTLTYTRH